MIGTGAWRNLIKFVPEERPERDVTLAAHSALVSGLLACSVNAGEPAENFRQ